MQKTRSRVLAAAFVAALCTALSACSGGGSSNSIPQTDSHAVQAPAQPAQAATQTAVSRTESIVADNTAATADGSFTYTNFSYHVMATHTGTAATAKSVRHTAATTYPMDLAYYGGPLSPNVTTHNIYLDCSKLYSCWGRPLPFLTDLGQSSMLQMAAQYDGAMSLTPGQSISEVRHIYTNTLYQNDLLHYIHKAIWHLGGKTLAGGKAISGYSYIYNLFL